MATILTLADSILAALLLAIGATAVLSNRDPLALASLAVSLTVAYVATIRPSVKRPRLLVTLDDIRCSPPTLRAHSPSWFVRLRVTNHGLTVAKGCIGRLLGVWTEQAINLEKFDPLTLYWARYDSHTGYKSVDIQAQGDFEYLDVLQAKAGNSTPLFLRVVIPDPMTLPRGPEESASPGIAPTLRPGKYYFKLGAFSENANPALQWLEIDCKGDFPESCADRAPCSVQLVRPPHGIRHSSDQV